MSRDLVKQDIETFSDPDNPQVLIIDDVLGVLGLDMADFNKLEKYQDRIKEYYYVRHKSFNDMFGGSLQKQNRIKRTFHVTEKHLVQFSDDANSLTAEDKRELLVKYNLDDYVLPVKHMKKTSKMFTILCKLSAQNKEFRFYGSHFFTPPVPCILNAMEQMKTENKFQYVSLVLLMVNQNKLS